MAAEPKSIHDLALKDIDGKPAPLKPYKGQVLLVVNVASHCGATPQYAGLEALHRKYKAKGFAVLGFPCNDFGAQEPGAPAEIKQFCRARYEVSFPLFEKIRIKEHPLYTLLTAPGTPGAGDIGWNFEKFLIGRDGKVIKRFETSVEPDDADLTKSLEKALSIK
ncbi:MAG: glutathione peroxidase [Pedosphaera sp.]|nr:glutathione peroxidase [Pedosphaera sp.]